MRAVSDLSPLHASVTKSERPGNWNHIAARRTGTCRSASSAAPHLEATS